MVTGGTDREAAILGLVAVIAAGDGYRRAATQQFDLDVVETEALAHLDLQGPMTQTQLARLMSLSSGGVTGVVDRLERNGTARRVPDPDDRRRNQVELTDRARTILAESNRGLGPAFDGFEPEVLATLAAALPRLAAGLSQEAGTLRRS